MGDPNPAKGKFKGKIVPSAQSPMVRPIWLGQEMSWETELMSDGAR